MIGPVMPAEEVLRLFRGRIGLSRPTYSRFGELVNLARDVVDSYGCRTGRPGCVLLSRRPDGNAGVSKQGPFALLGRLAFEENAPGRPVARVTLLSEECLRPDDVGATGRLSPL